ncbi:MAG: PEP-CTERM sorting domain-containing protein [Pirellulales bacterium]|nr:PEP-CTERM sorting domain-containing protein [Pirellulales bacterium]
MPSRLFALVFAVSFSALVATASAAPILNATYTDVGGGYYAIDVTLDADDANLASFFLDQLTFTGGIKQTKAYSKIKVDTETNAAAFTADPLSGYDMDQDSWFSSPWTENLVSPSIVEAANSYAITAGTGGGSQLNTVPVGRIVANTNVDFAGIVARLAVEYPLAGTFNIPTPLRYWVNAAGGTFSGASNWSPLGAPGLSNTAVFDLPNTYTVNFDGNVTNDVLSVRNGAVTFNLAGNTYTLASPSVLSTIGEGAGLTASLTINNGTLVTNAARIATANGGSGTVTVGAGGTWNLSGQSANIGAHGNGTLNIQGGGDVVSGQGEIGTSDDATGSATVSGAGSTWSNSGEIFVGKAGVGSLGVSSGGVVNSNVVSLGSAATGNGTATVSGTGSQLNATGALDVGRDGDGQLTVGGAGQVSAAVVSIGENSGATGAVTLNDAGSKVQSAGAVYVGGGAGGVGGTGSVTVNNGTLQAGGALQIYDNGSVQLNGGTINAQSIDVDGGLLARTGGTLPLAGRTLVVHNAGTLQGSYTVDSGAAVTIDGVGSSWTNPGTLRLAETGAASLTVSGGATVTQRDLLIGFNNGSNGTVLITGAGSKINVNAGGPDLGIVEVGSQVGQGNLTIANGGQLNVAFATSIGEFNGATGVATVTGAGSSWTHGDFIEVGTLGNGTLNVTAGGAVSNTDGTIGRGTGAIGAVTVSGLNSTWTNSGALDVGRDGSGQLTIGDSGQVSAAQVALGENSGATGTVVLNDAGSKLQSSGAIYVGGGSAGVGGTGSATVNNGTLQAGGALQVYDNGNVLLNGGTIDAASYDVDGGSLARTGGSLLLNGRTLVVHNAGTLQGNYTVNSGAAVTIDGAGSSWTNPGNLALAAIGSASLTVSGGATVTQHDLNLGSAAGSNGTALITGAGSVVNVNAGGPDLGAATIGSQLGQGNLTVSAGGKLNVAATTAIGELAGATGSANVSGAGSQINSAGALDVGRGGNGQLTVGGGGQVSAAAVAIGKNSGATGTVTLNDAGSKVQSTGAVYVGGGAGGVGGTGSLTVNNGTLQAGGALQIYDNGSVQLAGGTINAQNIDVDGGLLARTGGTLPLAGRTLTVHNAGTLQGGYTVDSGAAVTIDGVGSSWTNPGTLRLAETGAASLTVSGGATVTQRDLQVGFNNGSSGTVLITGAGSKINVNAGGPDLGIVEVGSQHGNGNLTVSAGGQLNVAFASAIGEYGDATGVATVTGAGSNWTNGGFIEVGSLGSGTLNVTAGGAVSNTYGAIGRVPGANGVVNVDGAGSTWTNNGALFVGGDSPGVSGGTGALNITGGAQVNVAGIANVYGGGSVALAGGTLNAPFVNVANGALTGSGQITGSVLNSGTVAPGSSSAGQLSIAGSYVQDASAVLNSQIGGLTPGSGYDQVAAAGIAALDGVLNISTIGGFTPVYGNTFAVVEAGLRSGYFSQINGIAAPGGLAYAPVYGVGDLTLFVTRPGDANLDGKVNGADYTVWADNFKSAGATTWQTGDFNGDGHTEGADYTIWADNFGATPLAAALPSMAVAVPEPSSLLLCGLGAALVAVAAARRKKV